MSIVAEFLIPPGAVPSGRTLSELPGVTIQLERIVPSDERVLPFFWVLGADSDVFLERLQTEPEIEDVAVLTELDGHALFQAEWAPEADVIEGIKTLQATILEATGSADGWEFQVRAKERERLGRFQQIFTRQGIPVEIQRIYNFAEVIETQTPITPEQREALVTAYERGYYDDPREVTQQELGSHFDISGRSLSDRLRRGTRNLIASSLLDPPGPE